MTEPTFLATLIEYLEQASIPHMVVGSFASTYHGMPRTTHDLDMVIAPNRSQLVRFVRSLPEEMYYVSQDAALEALKARRQFNVIEMNSGWKIDLIIRKARAFSVQEFQRRQPASLMGASVFVASAEDTVLAKLEWARRSDSERQRRDVRGILAVRGGDLDGDYLQRWLDGLNLREEWEALID